MIEPTSGDILLGRGVRINNHPGNEAYRETISENAVRRKNELTCCYYNCIVVITIAILIRVIIASNH
eukprot:scaffold19578_cov93-Skeletonema_dohrnii-CCMP3373.AAC.2